MASSAGSTILMHPCRWKGSFKAPTGSMGSCYAQYGVSMNSILHVHPTGGNYSTMDCFGSPETRLITHSYGVQVSLDKFYFFASQPLSTI